MNARPPAKNVFLAAGIAIFSTYAMSANAQQADEFFRGRTVSITVGYAPGGAYDLLARLVSRHMGKHIPGNPTVVVQNMPGAGSIVAANWLFNVAPKDGTAMGIVSQTVAMEDVLGNKGVRYKASEFTWIGRINTDNVVHVVWHTSKAATLEGAQSAYIPTASTGPGSPSETFPKLLNAVAGTRFKLVRGYAGASAGLLAMERGEVDGALTTLSTMRTSWQRQMDDGKALIFAQFLPQRAPELPDVPAAVELARNEDDKRLLLFASASGELGRAILAPPAMPPQRATALREAFLATMKDTELGAEARKARYDLAPASAGEVEKLVHTTLQTPAEIVRRMAIILAAD